MSTNNNASLRYLILDRCFSNTHHQYTIDELLDIVNEKLGDKQLLDNLSAIRHSLFDKEINRTNQFNKIIRRNL